MRCSSSKLPRRGGWTVIAGLLAAPVLLTGCGSQPAATSSTATGNPRPSPAGSGPEVAFTHLANPGGVFTLDVPVGWETAASAPGTVRLRRGTESIEAVVEPHRVAPEASSAWVSEASTLPVSPGPALIDVAAVVRGSGPAVLLRWSTTSATGERLVWDRYLFWRRGLLCRLTLAGPAGGAGFDPAERVSWSFGWRP